MYLHWTLIDYFLSFFPNHHRDNCLQITRVSLDLARIWRSFEVFEGMRIGYMHILGYFILDLSMGGIWYPLGILESAFHWCRGIIVMCQILVIVILALELHEYVEESENQEMSNQWQYNQVSLFHTIIKLIVPQENMLNHGNAGKCSLGIIGKM